MAEIIARHSSREVDQVMLDIDRDNFMSPADAADYGLIDEIIVARSSVQKGQASA
jgi:ATP-dependent Clp protease protease subunit